MATTPLPAMAPARKGRVVRPLTAPAPVVALPALPAAPAAGGRSAFWDNLNARLNQGDAGLTLMGGIGNSIAGIATHFSSLAVPTSFDVNTSLVPAQVELLSRGVTAIETLASVASTPPQDSCSMLEQMSDLAFSVVARIVAIAAQLMDRKEVTLESVVDKLRKLQPVVERIGALLELSDAEEADQAWQLIVAATDLHALLPGSTDGEALFDELNHRAALLVAAQCLVAGKVEGESDEWPPSSAAAL